MSSLSKPTLNKASAALSFAEAKAPAITKSGRENRVFNAPAGYRRLTINLPEDLHKKLRLAAVEGDCTATEIIERLLRQELS